MVATVRHPTCTLAPLLRYIERDGATVKSMKLSLEYLAGILDGEGCIFGQHDPRRAAGFILWVRINMCHRPFIQMLAEQLNASVIVHRKDLKNSKHRAAYEVSLSGKKAAEFLRNVYPFLVIKQEEARLALILQDNLERFNHRGVQLSDADALKLHQFRESVCLQLKALKRQSFIGVADGMAANSVDILTPDLFGDGQYRAKQELTTPGVCNEQVLPPKGKICSVLHGNMQSSAETTEPHQIRLVK